jgi:RNA polymerase sigma factor (sigma-70 family)
MGEEIGDIGNEHLVINLSNEQTEALNLLYTDRVIDRKLSGIAFRFGQDKDDLRQELALKLTEGYTLRDVKCLKSWCGVAATNICNNEYRHDKTVRRHRDSYLYENTLGKMRGGAVVLQRSAVKTPEQQTMEHELQARRRSVINSLPPDAQRVALLWDDGMSAEDIANQVGKSLATVYRKLKAFQKLLVETCGSAAAG